MTTNSIPEKGRAKKDKKKERQQPTKHTNKKKTWFIEKKCVATHTQKGQWVSTFTTEIQFILLLK